MMMQNGYKLTLATTNGTLPETYFLQKNDKAMDQNERDANINTKPNQMEQRR